MSAQPDAEPDATADTTPDVVTVPRAELDGMRSELGRMRAERKREAEERQAEEGRWRELAEARERELADLRGAVSRERLERTVVETASRLRFADPADAIAMLGQLEVGDDGTVDTAAVTSRLEQLAASKPYLLATPGAAPAAPAAPVVRTGASANGGPAPARVDDDPETAHGSALLDMIARRRGAAPLPFTIED